MKAEARTDGFTLIEVLIAMGLLGIILALILNWQMSTLTVSTRTNAMARSLNDLNDVTGYVGDRVRSAVRVKVFTTGSVNSAACSDDTPCLVVVVPVITTQGTTEGVVTGFDQYVYRMSNRANVNSDDKVEDSWADTTVSGKTYTNVQVLREYRTHSTSTPPTCTATPATFATTCSTMAGLDSVTTLNMSNTQPYIVADYLTPAAELPTAQKAFTYSAGTLTLNFQNKQRVRGVTTYLPATGPFTVTVQARNVP